MQITNKLEAAFFHRQIFKQKWSFNSWTVQFELFYQIFELTSLFQMIQVLSLWAFTSVMVVFLLYLIPKSWIKGVAVFDLQDINPTSQCGISLNITSSTASSENPIYARDWVHVIWKIFHQPFSGFILFGLSQVLLLGSAYGAHQVECLGIDMSYIIFIFSVQFQHDQNEWRWKVQKSSKKLFLFCFLSQKIQLIYSEL